MKKIVLTLLVALTSSTLLSSCGKNDDGYVYYLNFKPEQNDAWQKLAKKYSEKTGVEVTVLTAGSGQYETTLQSEMAKSKAPTLFQLNGKIGYNSWKDYCLDLTNSEIYKEVISDEYTIKDDGKVYGIAYVYEGYGLIVNTNLLNEAGYNLKMINSFENLKEVVEGISKKRKNGEIDFFAFTSSGLDSSSSWRFSGHLANIPLFYEFDEDAIKEQPAMIKGTYLNNFKNLWDLYINNATVDPGTLSSKTLANSLSEFVDGKAVFYQNGTWEYNNVKSIGDENLGFIPIYAGILDNKQGLCCGTENYWAVNSKVNQKSQEETLKFLNWIVTSDEGTTALAKDMEFISPFKKAKSTDNVLCNIMNDYSKEGYYNVSWAFNYTPNVDAWRNDLVSSLMAYSASQTSENWNNVRKNFVDGWAKQYEISKQ